MSELAALDTAQISFIAYWNVIEDGGMDPADFDPRDTIEAMETHEVFDNGVDGTIGLTYRRVSTRFTNCRVKDDGWIIVWLDRSKFEERDDKHGVHDVLNDWSHNRTNIQPRRHSLARAIRHLYMAIPDWRDYNFDYSDVRLFNYEHPDATVLTKSSARHYETIEIQPIQDTIINKAYAVGSASDHSNGSSHWIDHNGNTYDINLKVRDVTNGLREEEISKIEVGRSSSGSIMVFWSE